MFVWLCLRSVDSILCLFLTTLFLVCGVVSTCISPCRHTYLLLLIAIKYSNGNTCGKLTAINEKLYDILVYMYSSDRWAQYKTWWDDIEVCYTKYTHSLLKSRIYGVVSVFRIFQI